MEEGMAKGTAAAKEQWRGDRQGGQCASGSAAPVTVTSMSQCSDCGRDRNARTKIIRWSPHRSVQF